MNQKTYWNKVAPIKEFTTPVQMNIFKKYVNKKNGSSSQCVGINFSEN